MLESADYYVEFDGFEGRSMISHDGVAVARFESHNDALRMATHLANSASELGMYARVIEVDDDRRGSIVFERDPIDEADLPWADVEI